MSTRTTISSTHAWVRAGVVSLGFVALLWLVEIVDATQGGDLDAYGIQPRSEEGLWGIAFAPFLHGGWGHLQANSGPLLVLGFLVATISVARWLLVTTWAWLVSGAGVWLFAPSASVTIGASGVVFGLLTYLLVAGFLEHKPMRILVSALTFLLYGGVLLGVLPGQPGVSWQGHLFGAVGGVLAASVHARARRPDRA